jgi:hypothetical protein
MNASSSLSFCALAAASVDAQTGIIRADCYPAEVPCSTWSMI